MDEGRDEGPDEGGGEDSEPDHTSVPDDIEDLDEAYAQAVLDHLMAVYNDGYREAMQHAPVPADAPPVVLAAAISVTIAETWAESLLVADHMSLAEPTWTELEEQFLPPDEWRGRRTDVDKLDVVDDGRCLIIEGELDETQYALEPAEEARRVGHVLIRSDDVPHGDNESHWVMAPLLFLDDIPDDAWGPERCV